MKITINKSELVILEGDITEMDTEAIVNAANDQLILGAGVAGAIRTEGGPSIQEECDRIGGSFVGGAEVTSGGNLKAAYVIHAVGPRMGEGDEDKKLANATRNSLIRADEKSIQSIAFPAISTGIFGFPMDRAAEIMLKTVKEYLKQSINIRQVVFCLWGQDSLDIFTAEAKKQFEV